MGLCHHAKYLLPTYVKGPHMDPQMESDHGQQEASNTSDDTKW